MIRINIQFVKIVFSALPPVLDLANGNRTQLPVCQKTII